MTKQYKNTLLLLIGVLVIFGIYSFSGLVQGLEGYFLSLRAVKLLAIVIASLAISYSTITFQTITSNPLLTPSIMGLDSLYILIQSLIVIVIGSRNTVILSEIPEYFISIGLMILFSIGLFKFLFKGQTRNIYFIVLSGMILGQLFSGLSTFIQVMLDPNEFDLLQARMFASFNNINTSLLWISLILIVLILVFSLSDYEKLDVLLLGRDMSINLGVDYSKLVMKSLILIACSIAVSTALVGPLSFLGIIISSLSKQLTPNFRHKVTIFNGFLISCIFLGGSLILIERILNHATTMSTLINFIGGLTFIYLLIKERKR